MFKSKTLFIVGAGASCEAGLPSGDGLKGEIASLLDISFPEFEQTTGDRRIVEALREVVKRPDGQRGDINPYLHKAWRIRDVVPATAISIDNFLDAHRGDEKMELCGKLAIVRSILNAEAASKLRSKERGDPAFDLRGLTGSWFVGFFQMLTENVSKADVETVFDNVSIITFNYDRCVERFLVQALADYYEIERSEAERLVGKLAIYHPYGQVGPLPWQDRRKGVSFGAQDADLLALAGQIKTFSEGLDDEALTTRIHDEVMEADTLVFLGFAYHPSNMRLLTPPDEAFVKRIFATTFGLSDADEAVIEDDIFRMLGKAHIDYTDRLSLRPDMAKVKCGDFFKQYFRSLSAPIDEDQPELRRPF